MKGEIEIPSYDIVSRDRNRSGRVAIYIRNHIPCTIRKDPSDKLELIYVEMKKPKSKALISVIIVLFICAEI